MYKQIDSCRLCNNKELVSVLKLGEQTLTGVFPKNKTTKITNGPLELVKCYNKDGDCCGLVQLKHSYDSTEMYGENYGYRSGLNQSMVRHLNSVVANLQKHVTLEKGDIIIDIGGNDSTLMQSYDISLGLNLNVIDPTSHKFKKYYPAHINNIVDFFNSDVYNKNFNRKAKVITSIAMFYDLENPLQFVKDIYNSLDENGIWVFEQSYMPFMLKTNSYDTVCHEHLEYYSLKQISWMFEKVGFNFVDVDYNDINGGSFRITATKNGSNVKLQSEKVNRLINEENESGYNDIKIFDDFNNNVVAHKDKLIELLTKIKENNELVLGYGASTKGNVLLQYCGIDTSVLQCIAEVNPDKFGSFTPSTLIPIVSETEAKQMNPDYFLVLPWHFRENIIEREQDFLKKGGKLIFPLPEIEIYSL